MYFAYIGGKMSNEEIKSDESSNVANEESQKKSFLQRIKDWLGFKSKGEDKHEE